MKKQEIISNEILQSFKEFVLPEKTEEISFSTELEETGIDSLSLISFIVQVEETYGIEFDDNFLEEIMLSDIKTLIDMIIILVEEKKK